MLQLGFRSSRPYPSFHYMGVSLRFHPSRIWKERQCLKTVWREILCVCGCAHVRVCMCMYVYTSICICVFVYHLSKRDRGGLFLVSKKLCRWAGSRIIANNACAMLTAPFSELSLDRIHHKQWDCTLTASMKFFKGHNIIWEYNLIMGQYFSLIFMEQIYKIYFFF